MRLCNVVPGKNLANINKDPLEAALDGLRVSVNVQMAQMSGEEIFITYPSKNWWSFMFLFIQTFGLGNILSVCSFYKLSQGKTSNLVQFTDSSLQISKLKSM